MRAKRSEKKDKVLTKKWENTPFAIPDFKGATRERCGTNARREAPTGGKVISILQHTLGDPLCPSKR